MKVIISIILLTVAFYWLSEKGIVSFDNARARSYINDVQKKINAIDPQSVPSTNASGNMTHVNYEVNKLCTDLRDLSERALNLRKKLLANVVDSTSRDKLSSKKRSYKRY